MIEISVSNMIFTLINLLILFGALTIFLFKPVKKIIAKRREEADEQYEIALKKQSEADELKVQYEETLASAEEEKKQILATAKENADKEYQRIIDEAEASAKDIKDTAKSEADRQKAMIVKEAEKEIGDIVVAAATKVVGEQKGAEVDGALYDKFLKKAGDK